MGPLTHLLGAGVGHGATQAGEPQHVLDVAADLDARIPDAISYITHIDSAHPPKELMTLKDNNHTSVHSGSLHGKGTVIFFLKGLGVKGLWVVVPVDDPGDGVDVDGAAQADEHEGPEDEQRVEVLGLA
jgi:hypothetical protein